MKKWKVFWFLLKTVLVFFFGMIASSAVAYIVTGVEGTDTGALVWGVIFAAIYLAWKALDEKIKRKLDGSFD